MDRIVIGIAGGTASGKTTLASRLNDAFDHQVALLKHDNYYKSNEHLTYEERCLLNFDHPDAFDTYLLIEDLKKLKRGEAIDHPLYSFIKHTRKEEKVHVAPAKVIIVEGILVLENEELVDLMDIKVFVDTDADMRFIRRMLRDVNERGRELDSVVEQYTKFAKPMHDQFVEHTRRKSDIIIPNNGRFPEVAVDMLIHRIRAILTQDQQTLWKE